MKNITKEMRKPAIVAEMSNHAGEPGRTFDMYGAHVDGT